MTDYTNLKRRLQKLGFKVIKRFRDCDVLLFDGKTNIRLMRHYNGRVNYHAQTVGGEPISWHYEDTFNEHGVWTGVNNHIKRRRINTEYDYQIMKAVYYSDAGHEGHYATTY